ncbi:hypothetical protein [uncultured Mucilaginibacter sp.]|uniref:hypothetical protein n=1 Tax=uncultured Mucilaginibacter sp. TaxID=797541 RepID=UPI0025F8E2B8|nr:hypothetical protein [uncultured Mucilaginibacter sp.]
MLEQKLKDGMVQYVPVIFPKGLVHADVAKSMIACANETFKGEPFTVVSAGEIRIDFPFVSGNSDTLGVSSFCLDGHIVNAIDYQPFYEQTLHRKP